MRRVQSTMPSGRGWPEAMPSAKRVAVGASRAPRTSHGSRRDRGRAGERGGDAAKRFDQMPTSSISR